MNWEDDDEGDFNFNDGMSEDESRQFEREQKEKHRKVRNHPLYKLGKEILLTVMALNESIADEKDKNMYADSIYESALVLGPKIAGAMHSESWLISMQNASLVRYHAEYLLTSTAGLKMLSNVDYRYVQILRDEVLEFRRLFKVWVAGLENLDDDGYDDEWGLFNRE